MISHKVVSLKYEKFIVSRTEDEIKTCDTLLKWYLENPIIIYFLYKIQN